MGIVSLPNLGPDPFTVNASVLNGKVDPLATEFNGSIDNDNVKAAAGILASKLNLSSIAQAIAMSSKEFLWAKGADVASASSITLGTDGNVFDITGTTNIQTITAKQAGSVVVLHFDGALTLVDDTGNLELQGSNLTVAAEDEVILKSDGTNWHLVSTSQRNAGGVLSTQGDILYRDGSGLQRLAIGTAGKALVVNSGATAPEWANATYNGQVVQYSYTQSTANTASATNNPQLDGTIPQSSEVGVISTLTVSHTPLSATNILRIELFPNYAPSANNGSILALFKDNDTAATAATSITLADPNAAQFPPLVYHMVAGGTSAITFKMFGGSSASAFTINAFGTSARMGTSSIAYISVTEIKAS